MINQQIDDDYDIFIGVMWSKFGTPTIRDTSGTKEEFMRAYQRHKNGDNVVIMFYFKNAPIEMNKISPMQIQKIIEFKSEIGDKGGLWFDFGDIDQFKKLLRIHLAKAVNKFTQSTESIARITIKEPNDEIQIDNSEPTGMLDSILLAEGYFAQVEAALLRLTNFIIEVGQDLNKRTAELNVALNKPEPLKLSAAIQVINNAADDMDKFSTNAQSEIVTYKTNFESAYSEFINYREIATQLADNDDTKNTIATQLDPLKVSIPTTVQQMEEFKSAIANFPPMTSKSAKASRKMTKVLDDLINEFNFTLQLINEF